MFISKTRNWYLLVFFSNGLDTSMHIFQKLKQRILLLQADEPSLFYRQNNLTSVRPDLLSLVLGKTFLEFQDGQATVTLSTASASLLYLSPFKSQL